MALKVDSPWYDDAQNILAKLQVESKSGLSDAEAEKRKRIYGPNEIPPPPPTSMWELILEQFKDTLVLILLAAAVISLVLAIFEQDAKERTTAFVEPFVILTILICNATVGVIQENNAEKAIESLKESEAKLASVVRHGTIQEIKSEDIVPGDIVIVAVGDKIPADARIIEINSSTLSVNESGLTGESEAADKHVDKITKPGAVNQDKHNMLFSGTLIVRGKAKAVVTSTGSGTEIGAIAKDLEKKKEAKTPLQEQLDNFG